MRVLLTRPEPTPRAPPRRCAPAVTRRSSRRCCASRSSPMPSSAPGRGRRFWSPAPTRCAPSPAHRRRDELRALPVFAVGQHSAQAMRAAGFADVSSADGNVNDLADLVAARMKPGAPLLYLAGEERSGDLAGVLRARNFAVHTVAGLSRRRRRRRCRARPPRRWRPGSTASCTFRAAAPRPT